MAKKIVTISIVVDMDKAKELKWANNEDFFESEIEEVLDRILDLSDRPIHHIEKAKTESGTAYSLIIRK